MEEKLYDAARDGQLSEVKRLLRENPAINVNWQKPSWGGTPLHCACQNGHGVIVGILLSHSAIDVNLKTNLGHTAFYSASFNGCASCVREMLKDSRVNVNEPNYEGSTPLWQAVFLGRLDTVRWWVASGREMNLGKPGVEASDVLGIAIKKGKMGMVPLLESWKENPEKIRLELAKKLGWNGIVTAAEMFALVVFVSDGLLRCQANDVKPSGKGTRFFNIASKLPLELQMLLCNRTMGSAKQSILSKSSEAAFKDLSKYFW